MSRKKKRSEHSPKSGEIATDSTIAGNAEDPSLSVQAQEDLDLIQNILMVTDSILIAIWGMLMGLAVTKAMTSGLTFDEFWTLRVSHSVTQSGMIGMGYLSIFYEWRKYADYHFIGLLGGTMSAALWLAVYWFGSMEMVKWANYGTVSWALGGGVVERTVNLIVGFMLLLYYGRAMYSDIKSKRCKVNQEEAVIMCLSFLIGCGIERYAR